MAKEKPAKQKQAKGAGGKSGGKDKKGKDGKAKGGPSIANHPRAAAQVRRAKGWGGLIGFGLAGYLSLHAGVGPLAAGIRALAGGVVAYLLAWACAVTVWRHLVLAELRVLVEGGQLVPRTAPAAEDPPPDSEAGR